MLIAIAKDEGLAGQLLRDQSADVERIYQALQNVRGNHRVTDQRAESRYQSLEKYSTDLTELARAGKLDPIIGRDTEIQRVMQTLIRRNTNHPVLIGGTCGGKPDISEC